MNYSPTLSVSSNVVNFFGILIFKIKILSPLRFKTIYFALQILIFILSAESLFCQYMPVLTNERGDTIHYSYPIPDSVYKHDEIIIKIRPNALNLTNLCYTIPYEEDPTSKFYGSNNNTNIDEIPDYFKSQLLCHKFTINELIIDNNLISAMNFIGVDSIRRMTSANPCTDTISISRLGDTLKCEDFLWFVLELNNDTSVANGCLLLTITQQNSIFLAEPNYKIELTKTPNNDGYFSTEQISLSQNYGIGVERAWDFETGDYNIKIGVVDDGINWNHCEFGFDMGENFKISSGWNYWNPVQYDPNNPDLYKNNLLSTGEQHGTQVAGIIGALTNQGSCGSSNNSVSGIAGGWFDDPQHINLGCKLIALKVHNSGQSENYLNQLISAVLESSSNSNRYGGKVDILNFSVRLVYDDDLDYYSESFKNAIIYAYENNVNIVASRGNEAIANINYPSCFNSSMIISVGGANGDPESGAKCRFVSSSYGQNVDLLAPWGSLKHESPNYLPPKYVPTYAPYNTNEFNYFYGTSASAPHVSGVIGLLRSYALHQNQYNLYSELEPEDYEGMLKASSYDIVGGFSNEDICVIGYDKYTGWGYLKADNLFNKLSDGYKVEHFTSSENDLIEFGNWSSYIYNFKFTNTGLNDKPIPDGLYKVRRRPCSVTVNLPDLWEIDENNDINRYVWGRSGRDGSGGFSLDHPNYQVHYTQILNGERSLEEGVDGIFLNSKSYVVGLTYQYEVTIDNNEYYFPTDTEIAINFSIFGKPKPESINTFSKFLNLTINPNPFSNEILITNSNPHSNENYSVEIYNILGLLVYRSKFNEFDNTEQIKINTSNFAQGIYIIKVLNYYSFESKIMVKL